MWVYTELMYTYIIYGLKSIFRRGSHKGLDMSWHQTRGGVGSLRAMHSLKSLCFIDLLDFFLDGMYLLEGGPWTDDHSVLGQGVLNPQRARQDVQWDKRCCRTMASEKEKSAGSNENVLSLLDGLGHFCSPVEQNHKTISTMRPSSCTAHAFFSAIRARKWRREWGVCGERSKIVQDSSINDSYIDAIGRMMTLVHTLLIPLNDL